MRHRQRAHKPRSSLTAHLSPARRTFYRLYTAEGALLMVLRWISYRWQHAHYYLLDW